MEHKTVIKLFDIVEMLLILTAGFFLLKILFGFSLGLEALVELDTMLRGKKKKKYFLVMVSF